MSKAVLVIDMPANCNVCDLSNEVHGYHENCLNHEFCEKDKDFYERPSWCPLRPLPDSKKVIASGKVKVVNYLYANGFADGFNACLNEITGETE